MPDFDLKSAQRIAKFAKGVQASPQPYITNSSLYYPSAYLRPAILTGNNGVDNRYSWVQVQFNSDGTISQNPNIGSGDRLKASGYAVEATGFVDAIVGDFVYLTPNPDTSGNFSFLYDGKARRAYSISSSQARVGTQVVTVYQYAGVVAYGGQPCTIRFNALERKWYWELLSCQTGKFCCQDATRDTVKLTVSGSWGFNSNKHFPTFTDNGNAYGTFTLDSTSSWLAMFSCDGQMNPPLNQTTPCAWVVNVGNIGSGTNIYNDPASGQQITEGVTFQLQYRVGIGLSNDYKFYSAAVVVSAWACGHYNDLVNGFATGPVHFGALELFFGEAFLYPTSNPTDPFDCQHLVHLQSTGGGGGGGVTISLDPA